MIAAKKKSSRKPKARPLAELPAVTKSGFKVNYKKGTPVKFVVPRSGAVGKGKVDHVAQTKTGPFIHIDYGDAASGKVLIPIRPSNVTEIKQKPAAAVADKPKRVRSAKPAAETAAAAEA